MPAWGNTAHHKSPGVEESAGQRDYASDDSRTIRAGSSGVEEPRVEHIERADACSVTVPLYLFLYLILRW